MSYAAGSFLVPMAQPKMGLVRYLLGRTFYPDNTYTRDRDGTPIRPYDMATDTMAEFMGVRVDPVDQVPQGEFRKFDAVRSVGKVEKGVAGYVIDGRENDAFKAVNLLLDKGVALRRVGQGGAGREPRRLHRACRRARGRVERGRHGSSASTSRRSQPSRRRARTA